jgi:adenosylcobinamide kinase / adenosylcobinamide-phosphate guanylyltransferase
VPAPVKAVWPKSWQRQSGYAVTYIATSQPQDGEMSERVRHHRERRPAQWGLIEEPLALARVLRENARADTCLLVDCLTLWMTNLLMLDDAQRLTAERDALLDVPGRAAG